MINKETIQRIGDATHIEDIISEFVSLKKRGSSYVGCCPFHNEKTPSFVVTPAKGIFKCFGCGKAGDSVRFLMEHEHYSYPEALRFLAQKYHIEIEEEQQTEEQIQQNNERDALFHVSEFAQKYFAELLYHNEMGSAIGLSYFHGRGLSDEVIQRFGLGYCLDEWSNFTDHAHQNGYSNNVLEKTGLTIFREDGKYYDRFRGRVMFPIYSISGRVLGFSGRVLKKEKTAAKYVNSPDSEIYNKSRILYGLFQARTAISRADKCYLVEGNIDVISMAQSGVENTVASCGTSLTTEQVRLIKRYTSNVTVLYDGDSAGIHAAIRAVNLILEEGMHVRVVLFPNGEDPDSYAQKYGSAQLQQYLRDAETNFVLFKSDVLLQDAHNDPIKKAEAVKETLNTIALVQDMLERTEYVQQCASKFDMPEAVLSQQLAQIITNNRRKAHGKEQKNQSQFVPVAESADIPTETILPNEQREATDSLRHELLQPTNCEEQEKHLIALLLGYGTSTIHLNDNTNTTSQNNVTKANSSSGDISIHQFIIDELQADGLTFGNPLYNKYLQIFIDELSHGHIIDGSFFTTSDDDELRNTALSFMMEPHQLSPYWSRRYKIYIPKITDRLKTDVYESLLCFKQKKLQELINDNARQMLQVPPDDELELFTLMNEKMRLDSLKIAIGQQLHRVITP
ncbi:MAG: DNA primase [Bacteroidales bacterium]|nr:DNA primase [Bacteroidales bacterium]